VSSDASTNAVPEVKDAQHAGRRRPKVAVLWVIVASAGLLVFMVGLFGIAHPIFHHPDMYFAVPGDQGQPIDSAFPAQGGYFCDPGLFFAATCADVDAKEFHPQVPTVAKYESYEVWIVNSNNDHCHAIAFRVEGNQYTTTELGWLAPLDTAAPWALLLGFLGTVFATYRLTLRKSLVAVPMLVLPILVAIAYFSSHGFLGSC
jgi:hypothetical protein